VRWHFAAKYELRFVKSLTASCQTVLPRAEHACARGARACERAGGPGHGGHAPEAVGRGRAMASGSGFGDEETKAKMSGVAEGDGAFDYTWKFDAKSVA